MTILSESTQSVITNDGLLVLLFALITLAAAVVLLATECYKSGFFLLAITIAILVIIEIFYMKPYRRIKVILSDDYSAVELLDKYTVNGNEGEIWTLTEREPMEEVGKT